MTEIEDDRDGRPMEELVDDAVQALAALEREAMIAQLFGEPVMHSAAIGAVTATKEMLKRHGVGI